MSQTQQSQTALTGQNSIQKAYFFFKTHAGWCVGRKALGAFNMAKAEAMAKKAGVCYIWESDDGADMSFVETWPQKEQKTYWETEHFAECVLMVSTEGETLATLGGIIDADYAYRRVIEAELACETQNHLLAYSI